MKLRRMKLRTQVMMERVLGLRIMRTPGHGHRDWLDLRRSGCSISLVFDIGANLGESALKFDVAFAGARIHCFEPVRETFEKLRSNVGGYRNINCHHFAFGSSDGEGIVYLTEQSNTSSLIKPKNPLESEAVKIRTVDEFARDRQITRIDLLKIDTEGFDLEVLKGAQAILSAGQVPFVLVEVGFHPGDSRHVLFDDVRSFLHPMGYAVFGIYDQQLEWSGEKRLRFANVCFSNESAFTASRQGTHR